MVTESIITFVHMNCSLVIYEDNTRLRQSMELLLNGTVGYHVSGAYADCDNVIDDIKNCEPQLVVMDIDMPGIGGIEGVKKIKQHYPEVKVVMHTVFDDDNRIFDSICAGADGYLLKNTPPVKLIESLHDLIEGGAAMSPFVAQKVFQFFRSSNVQREDFNLSVREKEILELLVKGNSYKMIADKSGISIDTVKKHLQNIYHKLHVSCGTEAVAKALQHKIVRLD
jgi:DNA-binding NarL/FixJ family response regulator